MRSSGKVVSLPVTRSPLQVHPPPGPLSRLMRRLPVAIRS
jgi:hypothetical protein